MPANGYKLGWQTVLGGGGNDYATTVIRSPDGGYLAIGSSSSSLSGDIGASNGNMDIWIVKLDGQGDTLWTKLLGGSGNDFGTAAVVTPDGGFVIGGIITNTDNSAGNDSLGAYDGYMAKLSSSGQLIWSRTLGTIANDYIYGVAATSDGGYAFTGTSDGYRTAKGYDMWLGKVDANGHLLWHQSLGGSKDDFATGLIVMQDGGFELGGYSYSNDGDLGASPFYGGTDVCVIRTDGSGNVIWARNYGGSSYESGRSITPTADGGSVVAAFSASNNSGLVGNTHGNYDIWLIKLKSNGDTAWTKALGGAGYEEPFSVITTSYGGGGYAVAGETFSVNTGDVGANHGNSDLWVVELDSARNILYNHSLGGANYDPYSGGASLIRQQGGGGFIVASDSYSTDGDLQGLVKPGRTGDNLWIFQLH